MRLVTRYSLTTHSSLLVIDWYEVLLHLPTYSFSQACVRRSQDDRSIYDAAYERNRNKNLAPEGGPTSCRGGRISHHLRSSRRRPADVNKYESISEPSTQRKQRTAWGCVTDVDLGGAHRSFWIRHHRSQDCTGNVGATDVVYSCMQTSQWESSAVSVVIVVSKMFVHPCSGVNLCSVFLFPHLGCCDNAVYPSAVRHAPPGQRKR